MLNSEFEPRISLERRIQLLRGISSFEGVEAEVLGELAGGLGVETFGKGDPIIRENQFGDRLYFIESGEVGVYADGVTGELLLGKLGEGDQFGDLDLLMSTRRRRASVVALTPVRLLTLAAGPYERLVAAYPGLKADLCCAATEFMQRRLEALMQANPDAHSGPVISMERRLVLLRGIAGLGGLTPGVLDELAGCLGTEAYEEGVPIIRENQFGDRLYLIESGVVGVYTDGPTGEVLLGKLGEGDRFGDVDLLTSTRRRRVSVVALTPVAVLTLAAGPYERLVAAHPTLKGELSCAATDFMQHRLEVLMQANVDKFLPGAHEGP